jgi:hypothetical protein
MKNVLTWKRFLITSWLVGGTYVALAFFSQRQKQIELEEHLWVESQLKSPLGSPMGGTDG